MGWFKGPIAHPLRPGPGVTFPLVLRSSRAYRT